MLRLVDHPTPLELPLFGSPVEAGFPSPADDHIEGKLDLNQHLVRRPDQPTHSSWHANDNSRPIAQLDFQIAMLAAYKSEMHFSHKLIYASEKIINIRPNNID